MTKTPGLNSVISIRAYIKAYLYTTFLLFIIGCYNPLNAQGHKPDPKYTLISEHNYVQAKNYYLLTLLQQLPDVRQLLSSDAVLSSIARDKTASLSLALTSCNKDAFCFTGKMKFTNAEMKKISDRLEALYTDNNALGRLVKNHLIPSGAYIVLADSSSGKELLKKAWEQDANGVNYAINVYAEGSPPNYPDIDSISFHIRDTRSNAFAPAYVSLVYNTTALISKECAGNHLFFMPSLTCALEFLEMNEREQAGDFEPMGNGENKVVYNYIKTIQWNKYKYALILVPGAGPQDREVVLSAEGKLRCRFAALQYAKGVAPLIVVSGGKAHPYKTKFCEAIEMKRFMTQQLHIPGNVIIIEPHARHTTTNIRNTARIMFHTGIPFNKPSITCTTKSQSIMITDTLIERCLKELHEVPYKNGARLSETEVEFYPLVEALQINPFEPLDP